MSAHQRRKVVSYREAGFTMKLARVSFQRSNGDVLLSDIYLDQAGQCEYPEWRWGELTGYFTFVIVMSFQVILGGGMLSARAQETGRRRTSGRYRQCRAKTRTLPHRAHFPTPGRWMSDLEVSAQTAAHDC